MTKTTARLTAGACLSLLLAAGARAESQPPTADNHRVPEYEAAQNFFSKLDLFEPVVDFNERWQYGGQFPYQSLTAGTYARVERHLKIGAFYRVQDGARHDDDWVRSAAGVWAWRDTSRRTEHVLVLDATPRTELKFLPGANWVGSVKFRYERNFTEDEDVLKIEPELAYFWMSGLKPIATVFIREETDLALNFGGKTVWQRWYYLAGLWHAKPWLSLGPSIALRDETWSTSSSFQSFTGSGSYSVLYRAWVAGFTVVARLR